MSKFSRVFPLAVVLIMCMEFCFSATIPRGFETKFSDEIVIPRKRPFCNSYGGCGKRSQNAPGMPVQELIKQRQMIDDDALAPILDSEQAIDELSRQILSEAKLWEAIQEASAELSRRKQKDMIFN